MPFDWTRFLALAQELTSQSDRDEAKLRTAVSRAYYAAYHVSEEYCRRHGYLFKRSGQDHKFVRECLAKLERSEASVFLHELHLLRIEADYRDPPNLQLVWLWASANSRAEFVIDQLNAPSGEDG
jgi:hypothetical protein